jgi:hypothetical protein
MVDALQSLNRIANSLAKRAPNIIINYGSTSTYHNVDHDRRSCFIIKMAIEDLIMEQTFLSTAFVPSYSPRSPPVIGLVDLFPLLSGGGRH